MYVAKEDRDWNLFKHWVKIKNPSESYEWGSPWKCAAGQFYSEHKKFPITNDLYSRISNFAYNYKTFGQLATALHDREEKTK